MNFVSIGQIVLKVERCINVGFCNVRVSLRNFWLNYNTEEVVFRLWYPLRIYSIVCVRFIVAIMSVIGSVTSIVVLFIEVIILIKVTKRIKMFFV